MKCLISRPGLFEGFEIEFDDRLNIISGPNGSGKTFMAKCLMECFCKVADEGAVLNPSVMAETYAEVTYSLEDGTSFTALNNPGKYYRLEKNNEAGKITVYEKPSTDTASKNFKKGDADLQRLMQMLKNLPPEVFFKSSFIFSPTEDVSKNIVQYDYLKKIFMNDSSGFYRYVELFNEYENSSAISSGIEEHQTLLKDISKKIQLIEIQNSRLKKLISEKEKITREVNDMVQETEKISEEVNILKSIDSDLAKSDELKNRISELKQEIKEEDEKRKSINKIKKDIENLFPQFRDMDYNDSDYLDSLQRIFIEVRNINEKIEALKQKNLKRKKTVLKSIIAINSFLAVSAGFCAVELNGTPEIRSRSIGIILAVSFIISILLFILYKLPPGRSGTNSLEQERETAELKLEEILKKGSFQLEGYRLNELYEFLLQYFEDYVAYIEVNSDLRSIEKNLKGGRYIDKIKQELNDLENQKQDNQKNIQNKLLQAGIEDDNSCFVENMINDKQTKSAGLKTEIDEKRSILEKIDEEIAQYRNNTDELETLSRMKADAESTIWELNRKLKGFKFIHSALNEAAHNREKVLIKKLIGKSHEIFHSITGNTHIAEVDDICIENLLKNNNIPENLNLSQAHLLLMSIKLSLSEFLVDSKTALPLIIDEAFHFLDNRRIEKIKGLLEEISLRRQVIILTHHDEIRFPGNHIELK